ncbi:alpha-galactosidase [Cryptosporangium sp. NPDC051539]|uniref:alpha-galactosidase n=1 Tax=Cryptosporangium sp. NPDC051539 TaxID=3363962 RepID=UPI0037B6B00C
MTRIVFIGAGSVVFTRQLVADLLRFPDLPELDLVLHDIDPARLEVARGTAAQLSARFGRPLRVTATVDRRTALDAADVVVDMIQVGGIDTTSVDIELPASFGLRQPISDTTGIGGVFRALRTFPVLSAIARDMRELCPDALFLNYTNPMAMNIWWLSVVSPQLRATGLCHSVYWTVHDLCALIGVPVEGTHFRAAGVNHQAWLYEWSRDGEDLYPRLRDKIAADPELERRVRVEIFRRIGYYPTETSEHSAEYLSWFLRSDEQIERFRLVPGQHLATAEQNLAEFRAAQRTLAEGKELELDAEGDAAEYAPQIIHSLITGTEREIHTNIPNRGFISNLPRGAVVEVPTKVDGAGLAPITVGAIPTQGAAHNRTYLSVAELTVEAALTGRRDAVLQAMLVDPNASSTLTPDRLADLVDEMFKAHQVLLPSTLGGGAELDLSDVPARS